MGGSITYNEFLSGCEQIVSKGRSIGDEWCLRVSTFDKHVKYLVKRTAAECPIDEEGDIRGGDYGDGNATDEDVACKQVSTAKSDLIIYEYHIVYSLSYSVPVLYFKANKTDGRSLTLDEIWERVPKSHHDALDEKWSFITQTDHPILGYPVFHIHPCHTVELMRNLFPNKPGKNGRYLFMWLSALGPLVGLKLPSDFFNFEKHATLQW